MDTAYPAKISISKKDWDEAVERFQEDTSKLAN
jgi:hypothetical protein